MKNPIYRLEQSSHNLAVSLAHARAVLEVLNGEATQLKESGLIHATAYWRQGKYFCLVYPAKEGKARSFRYVGRNVNKIRASQAAMQRAREYDRLLGRIQRIEQIADKCAAQLMDVHRVLSSLSV